MTPMMRVMWYTVDEGEKVVNVCDVGGFIWEIKVSTDIDYFPFLTRTYSMHMTHYLNVRQRKLGTIIIQTIQCPYPTEW